MATKYIVNNVSGQTINGDLTINGEITSTGQTINGDLIINGEITSTGQTINGDLTINGNLNVTGVTNNNSVRTYRALMTQTGSQTGTTLDDFNYGFIIGETYTIIQYSEGDDFNNIADVQSGVINTTGCVFIATGGTPTNWVNGSTLTSDGGLVVSVLENTLGFDIDWSWAPFGGSGYYVGINSDTGPITNTFPRNNVQITTQLTEPYDWGFPYISITCNPASFEDKDDVINLEVNDFDAFETTNNALYYTPIEIKINYDITPFVITPTVTPSYPFNNAAFYLFCNATGIGNYSSENSTVVNNATELVTVLNGSDGTNFLGIFSVNESDEIILTMTSSIKQQYCEDNTLTMEIFQSK